MAASVAGQDPRSKACDGVSWYRGELTLVRAQSRIEYLPYRSSGFGDE